VAVGVATAWLRFASIIGPTVVGMMLAGGLPSVFATFATVAAVAAAVTGLYAVETKGRVLQEASPLRGDAMHCRGFAEPAPSSSRPMAAAPLQRGVKIGRTPQNPPPRRTRMRLSRLMFASVAAAALFGASAARSAEPVKIRMSWVAPVTNWASIILEKKDLARYLGKSYTIEPVRFAGTPPMVTALANGELEVSNLAYSTLAIAIENAR